MGLCFGEGSHRLGDGWRRSDRHTRVAEQFEQVVGGADQGPFALDLLQTSQEELPEASTLLDLAEDRLHGFHA